MSLFETYAEDGWRANAQLSQPPAWVIYQHGYELAAKLLMERTASGKDQDFLIYPILFTARQAIELGLKEIMLLGTRLSGRSDSYPKTHDLELLWENAKDLLIEAGNADSDSTDSFEALLKEVHAADPGSMTFRYPVDKQDSPSFTVDDDEIPRLINTRSLNRVLCAMFNYLSGARDWLENIVETNETALHDLSGGDEL